MTPGSLALEQVKLENKMVQRQVLLLVGEVCASPLCETMRARMKRLLKKLRSLMLVMKRLGSCHMLRIKATEAAVDSELLQQKITYPFLYTALLHKAFKLYPEGPSGQVSCQQSLNENKLAAMYRRDQICIDIHVEM